MNDVALWPHVSSWNYDESEAGRAVAKARAFAALQIQQWVDSGIGHMGMFLHVLPLGRLGQDAPVDLAEKRQNAIFHFMAMPGTRGRVALTRFTTDGFLCSGGSTVGDARLRWLNSGALEIVSPGFFKFEDQRKLIPASVLYEWRNFLHPSIKLVRSSGVDGPYLVVLTLLSAGNATIGGIPMNFDIGDSENLIDRETVSIVQTIEDVDGYLDNPQAVNQRFWNRIWQAAGFPYGP